MKKISALLGFLFFVIFAFPVYAEEPSRNLPESTARHILYTPKETAGFVPVNPDESYQPAQTGESSVPYTGGGSEEEIVPESDNFSPLWLVCGLVLAFFATELSFLKRRKLQAGKNPEKTMK